MDCQFDQYWRSDCRFRIQKMGPIEVKSKFDPCTSPPLLDMAVQVDQHTWKLAFVPSNRREARIIGLEYWPLRLHVNFHASENDQSAQSVLGCIESMKNGDEFCFLNTTIGANDAPRPACHLVEASPNWTLSVSVICLLLTALLLAFSAFIFVWCRRRNFRGHLVQLETSVPQLPLSKPYIEDEDDKIIKSTISAKSKSKAVLNPIMEEASNTASLEHADWSTCSTRWRQSKLVQTSLPYLEAAEKLVHNEPTGSSASSDGGSGPSQSESPNRIENNDKQKLICSSSSESSV